MLHAVKRRYSGSVLQALAEQHSLLLSMLQALGSSDRQLMQQAADLLGSLVAFSDGGAVLSAILAIEDGVPLLLEALQQQAEQQVLIQPPKGSEPVLLCYDSS